MFRRTLAATMLAAGLTACGSGIQEVQIQPAPSPLKIVADSTATLVSIAAHESDTAMVRTRVATIARSLDDAQKLVQGARSAVVTAGSSAAVAIRQGDWLRNVVAGEQRGEEFAKYWSIGRVKLDEARAISEIAVAVADSALACTQAECAAQHARQMQQHVVAAAGAAREAESMVRVALVHVR
jgi:hypothetical protein